MYDVIIIGAGPAGLMAGIKISGRVLFIEKNKQALKKLLLTGNGRCNITNLKDNQTFLNNIHNKKYLFSALNNFGPQEIYDFFSRNNVLLKEEKDNRLFPKSDKSVDIANVLLKNNSHPINYQETVRQIKINNHIKEVITDKNMYKTKNIIVATGGSSYQYTGSTGDNIKFAKMVNQEVTDIYPCEVGITLVNNPSLAGISLDLVVVTYLKKQTTGNLIFTHHGLSGEAIMNMSENIYQNKEKNLTIDLCPHQTTREILQLISDFDRNKQLNTCLNMLFPKKLSNYIIEINNFSSCKIKELNEKQIMAVIMTIKNCPFICQKVNSLDYAYITGGGIDMNYINTKTMESINNPGLYFIGETLDIHGPVGGYNLTIALATGYTAGISIGVKND
ncbi:MAG: aminoacetone oxidase family FAD-binding enzyme [Bacilli bacterium]